MTNGILSDWEISGLIQVCREMTKANVEWLAKYGNCDIRDESPPNPRDFRHYLKIRNVVREAMEYRREHRKAVAHVWKVFADHIIEQRNKESKNEPAI